MTPPSAEVTEAVGRQGETLEARRARLRAVVAKKSEKEVAAEELAQVEAQIVAREQAALPAEAERYVLGELRAISSLAAELTTEDGLRLLAAAEVLRDEAQKLNDRFNNIIARRHSLRTVVEAFGLTAPTLPQVVVPASRKVVQDAFAIIHTLSMRDHGFVQATVDNAQRRTFEEPELSETARALLRRKTGRV